VALALTLTTGQRGARNRGRVYLGPLGQGVMGSNGLFDTAVQQVANKFGRLFVNALNAGTGNRLHVVSRSYGTSVGVNGVSVGLVPDSQRRRRNRVSEQATAQWAPAGG
jgi:hypothetical protein